MLYASALFPEVIKKYDDQFICWRMDEFEMAKIPIEELLC